MFLDARQIDDGSEIECDICIVGAGAAGISIALSLSTRRDICLLESGGLQFDADTQSLNEAQNRGREYFNPSLTRLRYFGGTTNHWEGFCTELQESDFEKRSGIPYSGWPIRLADLKPFYPRARRLCQLGDDPDGEREKRIAESSSALSKLDKTKITTTFFQMSPPTRFGEVYRANVEQASNIRCLLWANAVELVPDVETATVTHAMVGTLSGRRFTVRARTFVLACGAIENTRLLLNSRSRTPRGLGNDADLVGRFFMEHPSYVRAARIVPTEVGSLLPFSIGSGSFLVLSLAPDRIRERGGNSMGFLGSVEVPDTKAVAKALAVSVAARRVSKDLPHYIVTLMEERRELARALLSLMPGGTHLAQQISVPPRSVSIKAQTEQSPVRESRVALSEEKDALGMQRVELDWRISSDDAVNVRRGLEDLGAELRRQGLGATQILVDPESAASIKVHGNFHQLGTTRMSDDPTSGVVDADCKVHGIRNLYVAGGSVFATSGWVTPTLTIVALALRLAAHLESEAP